MNASADLRDMRFAVAHMTADALVATAEKLRVDAQTCFSLICKMAGKTALGALTLYHTEMWYAGAALTRQLVEHHHLCVYFAEDQTRIEHWLDADDKDLRKYFSPAKLREAGGFTRTDYAAHCTWGGHPNPRGSWLLTENFAGHQENLLLVDVTQHLRLIYVAVARYLGDTANEIPAMVNAYNYLLRWQAIDPYANGLPVAADAQDEGA